MELYRIHGAAYGALDTMGTVLHEGRWHLKGDRVVYAAEHVSLAALEVLVHAGGRKLPPKALAAIRLPEGLSVETATSLDFAASQRFGSTWLAERRTAALRVPSFPVHGREYNYLLNPAHPQFASIRCQPSVPFPFDSRLFPGG